MKSPIAATGLEPVPPNVRAVCFPLHHAALFAYISVRYASAQQEV